MLDRCDNQLRHRPLLLTCLFTVTRSSRLHSPKLALMYLYELPTTGAISFADFCVDQSVGKWYATYISDATQARANVRSVLKDNKRTDLGEKDYLKLVKVCV